MLMLQKTVPYFILFIFGLFFVLPSVSLGQRFGTPDFSERTGGSEAPNRTGVTEPGRTGGPDICNPVRQFCNPIQSQNFTDLITRVAGIVAGLGIPVVAVVLVYGGFLFVSARGNEQKLGEAKQAFYWAIIGAVLVLGAFVIAVALKNFAAGLG